MLSGARGDALFGRSRGCSSGGCRNVPGRSRRPAKAVPEGSDRRPAKAVPEGSEEPSAEPYGQLPADHLRTRKPLPQLGIRTSGEMSRYRDLEAGRPSLKLWPSSRLMSGRNVHV